MKTKRIHCGECGRIVVAKINTTHGQSFTGQCKGCAAEYVSSNGGKNWYKMKMGVISHVYWDAKAALHRVDEEVSA